MFQAAPWTATVTDKVQGMGARLKTVDQMEARVVAAKHELKRIKGQLEVSVG